MKKILLSLIVLLSVTACTFTSDYQGEYKMSSHAVFQEEELYNEEENLHSVARTMKREYHWIAYAHNDYIYKTVREDKYYFNDTTTRFLTNNNYDVNELINAIIKNEYHEDNQTESKSSVEKEWDDEVIIITTTEESPKRKDGFWGTIVPEEYSLTQTISDYETKLKDYGYTYTLEKAD
ncbi:hypothetical protein ERUR111494_08015 [Erysipelothrix urinaevulpis]|uniref:hypothetical protein n=1 Tax=Erysipelothrix urinaevulpis TaxID=2683717 RepID=UPI001357AB6C|nr:hypothetical protein [Erysipelothrix urinaevulpis]